MMIEQLPAVNAFFNGLTALCLLAGFVAIKAGRRELHRALMLCAFGSATLFLVGYLVHTFGAGNTRFSGHGPWRAVYLTVLFSHMFLAVVVLPLILRTLYLGLNRRYSEHRPLAVWTWPLWVYVSVTGVLVYWMLFHLPTAWSSASAVVVP
jgi:putative membrane protein